MNLEQFLDDPMRRDWQQAEEGTVRFAMIGVGWWVQEFAIPQVADSKLCETTVLVTSSREKADRVADEHDVERGITYDEYHDGVAADAYDAVYVCTPNALHLQYAETAADLGKAVLCEKPMEASVERAERLVETCDGRVPLMVAYRMHTDPAVRQMRELVRGGAIGDPVSVHGSMSQRVLEIFEDPSHWRLNPDLAGPGTSVTDIGIYPLNTARFVLDEDPVAVQSMMHSESAGFEDVPDERAAFTLAFPSGAYATCSASQNAQMSDHLRVVGTEGEIGLELAFANRDDRLVRVRRDGGSATFDIGAVDQMREEFDYFADRLLTGSEIHADGEHGLADMRTIEAVYEAAEREETIEIE